MNWIGGIDGGGTTFKCVIADPQGHIAARARFAADDPDTTLAQCARFFTDHVRDSGMAIAALGIGCFGPLDLDPRSAAHGSLLATPKPHWSNTPVAARLADALAVPVAIDTDVNAALAGEMRWGAAKGRASAAYVTVGTGIGAGIYANGGFLGRPAHPEFGHISVARHPDDHFPGACSFHGDCLEGLASARAMTDRFGDTTLLPPDHPGWGIAAFYLAQACRSLFLTVRPERIILGGGLMLADGLIDQVRAALVSAMAGYLGLDRAGADALVVLPDLGDDAGVLGAVSLCLENNF